MKKFVDANVFMGSLTNLANQPFRRLVRDFGAKATISEMVVAHYAAKGIKQDLALMRRETNDGIFGVQIVGSKIPELVKAAQIAQTESADFIDFNCACPHASVLKHRSGALLLQDLNKLAECLKAIVDNVDLPVSLKIRKGYKIEDNIVLQALEKAHNCNAAAVFIHGRTKEALYRGDADWEIIETAAEQSQIPIIGCGDIAHGPDAIDRLKGKVSAVAIARAALMKPWIFQEINEQKLLDPSGKQRDEYWEKLVEYTRQHFGSDERGIKTGDRFLAKQKEFLCRYVPVGVLGYPPKMQERVDNNWIARDESEERWRQPSNKP